MLDDPAARMPGEVKRPHRYRSKHRREQAQQTRERVLEAAARLFETRGYEGASIAAIANEARVSAESVYARFGNKRTLLGELVRRAVRGDDPAPVPEQQGPRAILASTDQREQLRLFAADVVSGSSAQRRWSPSPPRLRGQSPSSRSS